MTSKIEVVAISLIIFGTRLSTSFIIKVKFTFILEPSHAVCPIIVLPIRIILEFNMTFGGNWLFYLQNLPCLVSFWQSPTFSF